MRCFFFGLFYLILPSSNCFCVGTAKVFSFESIFVYLKNMLVSVASCSCSLNIIMCVLLKYDATFLFDNTSSFERENSIKC